MKKITPGHFKVDLKVQLTDTCPIAWESRAGCRHSQGSYKYTDSQGKREKAEFLELATLREPAVTTSFYVERTKELY